MNLLTRFRGCFRSVILPSTRPRFLTTSTAEEGEGEGEGDGSNAEHHLFERDFVEMKTEDFKSIYKNDSVLKEKVSTILEEYEHQKYNSLGRVPANITLEDMEQLIEDGKTPHSRLHIFHYLFKREMGKRASKIRLERMKKETRIKREARQEEFNKRGGGRTGLMDASGNILYGLWHNSLFCRLPSNKLKPGAGSSDSRLRAAALFGRKLIFDFGFEDYMVKHAVKNSVDQVQEAYGLNRFIYRDPFDLWFCNFKPGSFTEQYTKKAIPNLYSKSMITLKEDCFTNHFDKSQLVYLSPNAQEPLNRYIHKSDDIYIIGVFNDRGHHLPLTYRKALKLGIRARSLPLDMYVPWQGPTKSLCMNHVTGILLEFMSNGGDWKAALEKHIPSRKIKSMEKVIEEEELRKLRFNRRRGTPDFDLRKNFDW